MQALSRFERNYRLLPQRISPLEISPNRIPTLQTRFQHITHTTYHVSRALSTYQQLEERRISRIANVFLSVSLAYPVL